MSDLCLRFLDDHAVAGVDRVTEKQAFLVVTVAARRVPEETRSEKVEAIVDTTPYHFSNTHMPCCSVEVFKTVKKLRLLNVKGKFTVSEPEYVPEDLIWLCWYLYPFQSLRIKGGVTKLVGLEMQYGHIKQLQIQEKDLLIVSGTLLPVNLLFLLQTFLLWHLGFSALLLGRRYSWNKIAGCLLVAARVVTAIESLGHVAPFDVAACILAIGMAIILSSWGENYGDLSDNKDLLSQFKGAAVAIASGRYFFSGILISYLKCRKFLTMSAWIIIIDGYFDDESAEVIISSLRLGDDQGSFILDEVNLNGTSHGGNSSSDDEVVVGEDEELALSTSTSDLIPFIQENKETDEDLKMVENPDAT
ncbi:major facilitator superfamily protein [Tanacetum coccineum]